MKKLIRAPKCKSLMDRIMWNFEWFHQTALRRITDGR